MTEQLGCQWVVGHSRKWNGTRRAYDSVALHCLKLVAPDSTLCPRHQLIAAELNKDQHRIGVYKYDPKGM
jgi:hypothetical protein